MIMRAFTNTQYKGSQTSASTVNYPHFPAIMNCTLKLQVATTKKRREKIMNIWIIIWKTDNGTLLPQSLFVICPKTFSVFKREHTCTHPFERMSACARVSFYHVHALLRADVLCMEFIFHWELLVQIREAEIIKWEEESATGGRET